MDSINDQDGRGMSYINIWERQILSDSLDSEGIKAS